MPRLWNETIAAHRHDVQEAILETAWRLVDEQGLLAVTMSRVAEETGIGRATLYKYFPNVEAILLAHHQRHVQQHLAHLTDLRDQPGEAVEKLEAVLTAFALISFNRGRHGRPDLSALLHRADGMAGAEKKLRSLFRDLIAEAGKANVIRHDVNPDELAAYCQHALGAAGDAQSEAAARRLAAVTISGLQKADDG
jgi:AcrR family transcriptional regulator